MQSVESSKNLSSQATFGKICPFTDSGNDLLQKLREDEVGGRSIGCTLKAVVDSLL